MWAEKLDGQGFLPPRVVDWNNITWRDRKQNWPEVVPLVRHSNGNNWRLEFRSYGQGWKSQQARSIGGFYFSEQVDWKIYLEVLRGCREHMFPGGQFLEFTPLQPDLCFELEKLMDKAPKGYGFYRMNTDQNVNVSEEWRESFFAAVPRDMQATRRTGALATFQGAIFTAFNVHTHTTDQQRIPAGCHHYRGFDWGFSKQHPFSCTWAYMDGIGDMRIYAEYWCDETITIRQHAKEILAISLAFGWPVPRDILLPSRENATFAEEVIELANKKNPQRIGNRIDPTSGEPCYRPGEYGQSYGDSSRPDCIQQFNQVGINTTGGTHEVLKGIEEMQSIMEVNPATGKPHLVVAESCQHHIEEFRKYHWKTRDDDGVKSHEPFKLGPLKRGDDAVDSTRYLVYNVRKNRGMTLGSTNVPKEVVPGTMEGQFSRHKGNSAAKRMMQRLK